MTTIIQHNEQAPRRTLKTAVPLAMAVSAASNLAIYVLSGAVFPEVTAWAGASAGQVVGASIIYLMIGTAVFLPIRRYAKQPKRLFTIVATLGLLLSLWMPISATLGFMPGTPATPITAVSLSLMHLAAYAITLPFFNQTVKK